MWLITVVQHYYPSVFHFDNKEEAETEYADFLERGYSVVHLSKVEKSNWCEYAKSDEGSYDGIKTAKDLDVEW